MKQVRISEFLTPEQIRQAMALKKAALIKEKVIDPNIEEINRKLGQTNDPMYLAYACEHIANVAREAGILPEIDVRYDLGDLIHNLVTKENVEIVFRNRSDLEALQISMYEEVKGSMSRLSSHCLVPHIALRQYSGDITAILADNLKAVARQQRKY